MLKIAFSPCPNDTFVFHAWVHGLVADAPSLDVTYADIDKTNTWAADGEHDFDVLKVSYAALPWMLDRYELLSCGGALGRGCGPLVLTADGRTDLTGRRVAVPSDRSTAYLLFRLWAKQQVRGELGEVIVMPFEQIMPAVKAGEVDAGLVIHEARFTYPQYGLQQLVDLGDWWERDTGASIPLGAIVAKRGLDYGAIEGWIRASVNHAWDNPEAPMGYVMQHAQEMEQEVARQHIGLYVNPYTASLGDNGYHAVSMLLNQAAEHGYVPPFSKVHLLPRK